MEKEKTRSAMSVASFVLGIISILGVRFYYITIISGVLAILFGTKSKKKFKSKLGLTGMILGIIGLSIIVFVKPFVEGLVIWLACFLYLQSL